ncbi:sulfotransferase 2A8-like [Dermacentor albipictus]|uniref:sulfotransferase 2A8-like n=1 Tax=Dermacentor albipictus TaxID=60249 RepID=UPI0038FD2BC0
MKQRQKMSRCNCGKEHGSKSENEEEATMDPDYYVMVDGVRIPKVFGEENFRSAAKYMPRDGDLFVVSYPKCGTSWMQYIVCSILTRGKPPSNVFDLNAMAPFIDVSGAAAAENPKRTGPIVTHIPPSLLRPNDRAKYIYVARNPYDTAVSFYYFLKGLTPKTVTDVSFQRYFPMFIEGKVAYGNYFDHLLPWYDVREKGNVLFITYEQLKADTKGQILRIADFIGSDHGAILREDADTLKKILDSCSMQSMKMLHNDDPEERMIKFSGMSKNTSATRDQHSYVTLLETRHEGSGFVRKGAVGDWRNHFTAKQTEITKAWIAEKCENSTVMQLWADLDLP